MDYRVLSRQQISDELEAIASDAEKAFARFDSRQANWSPSAGSWSVAQCLDHLIRINRAYYPIFDRIAKGQYRPPLVARVPLLPKLVGPMMVQVLSPQGTRKFKAGNVARPSASAIESDIVGRFIAHQRELLAWLRSLADRDLGAIVIRSPLAPVPYSLLDAFRILVAHERRHLAQARRVTQLPEFPADERR